MAALRNYGIAGLRDYERVAANAATQSHLMPSQMSFRDGRRDAASQNDTGLRRGFKEIKDKEFKELKEFKEDGGGR